MDRAPLVLVRWFRTQKIIGPLARSVFAQNPDQREPRSKNSLPQVCGRPRRTDTNQPQNSDPAGVAITNEPPWVESFAISVKGVDLFSVRAGRQNFRC